MPDKKRGLRRISFRSDLMVTGAGGETHHPPLELIDWYTGAGSA
jgi:hypothetical protein